MSIQTLPLAELPIAELSKVDWPIGQLLLATGVCLALLLAVSTLFLSASNRHYFPRRDSLRRRLGWISRLVYIGYLAIIAVLAISSFGSLVQYGRLSGYALQLHVAAAGGFVFLMAIIAALYLPMSSEAAFESSTLARPWWAVDWSAWALILSSLLAAGTMLLSMLPLLDTQELRDVAVLHRYAGLAVVVAAILHAYSLICRRLGWR